MNDFADVEYNLLCLLSKAS